MYETGGLPNFNSCQVTNNGQIRQRQHNIIVHRCALPHGCSRPFLVEGHTTWEELFYHRKPRQVLCRGWTGMM